MTDQRNPPDSPTADPTGIERIVPPEQPPMDDAAGPIEDTDTGDLSVQGGE